MFYIVQDPAAVATQAAHQEERVEHRLNHGPGKQIDLRCGIRSWALESSVQQAQLRAGRVGQSPLIPLTTISS